MDRKGQIVKSWLVRVIIVAIVAIILFSGFSLFAEETNEKSKIEKCRMEVLKASNSNSLPGFESNADCPIIRVGELDLPKDEEEAKQKLANKLMKRMKTCWDKFGEGEIAPYPGEHVFQQSHCYICSTFETPDNLPGGKWQDFDEILIEKLKNNPKDMELLSDAFFRTGVGEEKIKFMFARGLNYEESFLSEIIGGPNDVDDLEGVRSSLKSHFSGFRIDENEKYYLVNFFVNDKESAFLNGKLFFSTSKTFSKIAFLPEDEIHNACRVLEN